MASTVWLVIADDELQLTIGILQKENKMVAQLFCSIQQYLLSVHLASFSIIFKYIPRHYLKFGLFPCFQRFIPGFLNIEHA